MPTKASPTPRKAATPMAFVRSILLAYEKYGRDPAAALAQAQITPSALRQPEGLITAEQMEAVSGAAMRELDDEALGWFSRRLPWGSYGMLCRASITSPDLGVAIKRWCRHHALLTDDVTLQLQVRGETATLAIDEHRRLGATREFCLVTLLRNVHGFSSWFIDSRIALREVNFPFEAPAHKGAYPLMFPGPVYFEAPRAGFSFDAQYLALPLKRDERALNAMLQRALPLIVLPYRRDRLLAARVRELLRTRPGEMGTADALARELNVSVRTLHRQLHDEGTSLQRLKDEVRREQAMDQLRRSARPIKQIAQVVGFGNEKSFARAFRQWTGVSPGEFRRSAANGG